MEEEILSLIPEDWFELIEGSEYREEREVIFDDIINMFGWYFDLDAPAIENIAFELATKLNQRFSRVKNQLEYPFNYSDHHSPFRRKMSLIKDIEILIVDDSVSIHLAAEKMFRNLGFKNIFIADDGTTALEKLHENSFDLVIADWNMKEMSGIELFKKMKDNESFKDIPFILATGDTNPVKHKQANAIGIKNIMTKPFDVREIKQIFKKIFNL
jgi:CheY-like chemotaxis protein